MDMRNLYDHSRWLLVGVIALVLAGICACGAGGGSNSVPTSGSEGPIVEIPAVNSVSDLAYITAPVVGVSSDLSAKSAMNTSKSLATGAGSSPNLCETTNITNGLISDGSQSDLELCMVKNLVGSDTTIYNGQDYDVGIWIKTDQGAQEALARFKIVAEPYIAATGKHGPITAFTLYVCDNGSQVSYTNETFTAGTSSTAVTISTTGKDNNSQGNFQRKVGVSGNLNASAQYIEKTILQQHYQTTSHQNPSDLTQTVTNTFTQEATFNQQDAAKATVNGFSRNVESHRPTLPTDVRIFASFGFIGNIDNALDQILSGAARFIDIELDTTECWNENGWVIDSNSAQCSPYMADVLNPANTPEPIQPITSSDLDFTASETIDCASIRPGTNVIGSQSNPIDLQSVTECQGFGPLKSDYPCFENTYSSFTVTAAVNGQAASFDPASPTMVSSTAPTLTLTTNYAPSLPTFNESDLKLATYNAPPGFNSLVAASNGYSNWSSNYTVLTLTFSNLAAHQEYSLDLLSDLSGVDGTGSTATTIYIKTP